MKRKVYMFSLVTIDDDSKPEPRVVQRMSTHVDEPDPRADLEFWDSFIEQRIKEDICNCYMSFDGWYYEEEV